jgi:hypothetical protein
VSPNVVACRKLVVVLNRRIDAGHPIASSTVCARVLADWLAPTATSSSSSFWLSSANASVAVTVTVP